MSSPIVGFVCWLRGLRRRRPKHTPVTRRDSITFHGVIQSPAMTWPPVDRKELAAKAMALRMQHSGAFLDANPRFAPNVLFGHAGAVAGSSIEELEQEEERERDRRIFRALYAACPTHLAKLTDEELEAVRAACLPEEEREENHAGAFTGPPATDDGDTRVLEGPRDTAAQIAALLREGRESD